MTKPAPSTVEEFRERARQCLELAQRASEQDRQQLLDIANAWLALANDATALLAKTSPPKRGNGEQS